MSDLPSKGERTRQAILEAAYRLFIEQGYHATSMRQIARGAGVALGGIYNHFASKEQIFVQVLLDRHPYRQVLSILQATSGDSVEEFAHNAAHAVVSELGRRPDFLKLAFIELSEFQGAHASDLFHTVFPQFLPLIGRFRLPQGRVRDIQPPVFLLSFLGIFFAYYMTEAVFHSDGLPSPDQSSIDPFIDVYLYGILKPESPCAPD